MDELFKLMRKLLLKDSTRINLHTCILQKHSYSPDINLVSLGNMARYISNYKMNVTPNASLTFLDVGGRNGEFRQWGNGFKYFILEIDESKVGADVIYGDICACDHITEQFDVVFSNNVFEHLKEPWKAAENCVRLTKPGGLLIHFAPFSWRYHPVPVDYFRFSHTGLSSLFLRTGFVEQLESGYDISCRREDRRGGKLVNNLDTPPIDELGGWRENWMTVFVGQKLQD